MVHGLTANFLMVMVFPFDEMGESVALILSPVLRWASIRGVRVVISLPTSLPMMVE